MRIALIVEGKTERAFLPSLRRFLERSLAGKMPALRTSVCDGAVSTGDTLKRTVSMLLGGNQPADHVVWLTDLYPKKEKWRDAEDAKAKARAWVGNEPRFHPHVAVHDFEAWLLPYWDRVKSLAKSNRNAPPGLPERVNNDKPPSKHIEIAFETGGCRKSYSKERDAPRILDGQDLIKAIEKCPELKAFVNTILRLCGANEIA